MKLSDVKIRGYISNDKFQENLVKMTGDSKYSELSIDNTIKELTCGFNTVFEDDIFIVRVLYNSFLVIYEAGRVCVFILEEDNLEVINLAIGVCRIVVAPFSKAYKHIFSEILASKPILTIEDIKLITSQVFKYFDMSSYSDLAEKYDDARSVLLYKESVLNKLDDKLQNLLFRQLLSSIVNDGFGNCVLDNYIIVLSEFVKYLESSEYSQLEMESKLLKMTVQFTENL